MGSALMPPPSLAALARVDLVRRADRQTFALLRRRGGRIIEQGDSLASLALPIASDGESEESPWALLSVPRVRGGCFRVLILFSAHHVSTDGAASGEAA